MAKKRKKTTEEIVKQFHGDDVYERHERVQRQLKAASDALKRRAEEKRRTAGQA
jgi:hypothetical protein